MDINKGGIGNVKYPLVSDLDKSIARAYDVLLGSTSATVLINDEEMDTSIGGNVTMRGSFLIDEEGVVRHAVLNDLPLGRNIDEMLKRLINTMNKYPKYEILFVDDGSSDGTKEKITTIFSCQL